MPFMIEAEKAGAESSVLVRNSNPDSSIYQAVDITTCGVVHLVERQA